MRPVALTEVVSPGCQICRVFEAFWESVAKDWPNVTYRKIDVTTPEGTELAGRHMIFASPGIILNDTLVSVGGFEKNAFLKTLHDLSG